MIHRPSRRDLIKYGVGAAAWTKMAKGQGPIFPGPGLVHSTGGGTTVTVNGTVGSVAYQNAVTTKDYTFTVSSGSNLALLVVINWGSIAVSSITATWDQGGTNQAMTQLVLAQAGAGIGSTGVFGLRAPTVAASATLRVSWTTTSEIFLAAICLAGVEQGSDGAAFPHTASSITLNVNTVSVTSATGNLVVGGESSGGSQGTATGTLIYDDHTSGALINAMANYDSGAASVTFGNSGTNNITIAAVDVAHA